MQLSAKSEYAILALIEFANHYSRSEPLQIKQIATQQNIPERYLEQLLATLRRRGLVRSQRGAKGGYLLGREPWQISLKEIIQVIEGKDETAGAGQPSLGTLESELVRETWQAAQAAAEAVLSQCTLQTLCDQQAQRQQASVMFYI